MTTMFPNEVTCCVCGTRSTQMMIGSTNAFGSPDLDTRPPEMERSTIKYRVQRCPSCYYCAPDLSECDPNASHIIKSPGYETIVTNKSIPEVAASFLALSYENQQMKNFSESAWRAIEAAWICDDENNDEAARECRETAISLIEEGKTHTQYIADEPGASEAITIDLMRRAGMFREAMDLTVETKTQNMKEIIKQVIAFEEELISIRDTDTHTISEASGIPSPEDDAPSSPDEEEIPF